MPADVEVRPLGTGEVRAAADVLARSFWRYSETCHLLPGERSRRRVLPRKLATDLRDSALYGGAHGAWRDGALVGAVAWLPPAGYPIEIRRELTQAAHLLPVVPWAIGAMRRGRAGQDANRRRHRDLPAHVWLRVLGVEPATQSAGVGTALVDHVLRQADAAGVGTFLFTATEANVAWYARFGFHVRDQYRPTPDWPWVWTLWRDPAVG